MSQSASVPESVPNEQTAPSRKPSIYVFDSNGDTQLILNTSKSQAINWEWESIWLGPRLTKEASRNKKLSKKMRKKEEKKRMKMEALWEISGVAELSARRETEEGQIGIIDSPNVGMSVDGTSVASVPAGTKSTMPQTSLSIDGERLEPGCADVVDDVETNTDNSNLQVEDWGYGERPGIQHNQVEVRMRVSGRHLALASSCFEKMLDGPFMEGRVHDSGLRRITASDWDPEAFNIVLTIMHGYHRQVPRSLSLEMLTKLAMIVDYYECHESVDLHAGIWLENSKSELPKVYGRDSILWIFISWVFSQPDTFQSMTRLALLCSERSIKVEDIPFPGDLLEQINKERLRTLDKIFKTIYDLVDRLKKESECSFECSSMLLGTLIKELGKHGIPSERNALLFYSLSIEGSKNMIQSIKNPQWRAPHLDLYGTHPCKIQNKLAEALDKVEKELRVFDLQNF